MTSITHVLIGASVAARATSPATAAVSSLALHMAVDMIPHWDLGTNYRMRPKWVTGTLAIVETLVALAIGFGLFWNQIASPAILTAAIVFSLLPDWIEAPYHILSPHAPRILYWLYKPQSILHTRAQLPWGLVTQIITVTVALYLGFGI